MAARETNKAFRTSLLASPTFLSVEEGKTRQLGEFLEAVKRGEAGFPTGQYSKCTGTVEVEDTSVWNEKRGTLNLGLVRKVGGREGAGWA